MFKVEGSKHGLPEMPFPFVKPCLEHVARDLIFLSRNLDFRTGKSNMKSTHDRLWGGLQQSTGGPCVKSFVSTCGSSEKRVWRTTLPYIWNFSRTGLFEADFKEK